MSAVPLPEPAAWRSQSPVGGHHFSETRPTGAVEKYPQTPLVTMEAAIAYGAACAAEQRERDAMIVQENAEYCRGPTRSILLANAAAIRASAMPMAQYSVTQVDLAVSMVVEVDRPPKTVNIHITYPNSCSLKYDELGLKLRDMLSASGIEPREPEEVATADAAPTVAPATVE